MATLVMSASPCRWRAHRSVPAPPRRATLRVHATSVQPAEPLRLTTPQRVRVRRATAADVAPIAQLCATCFADAAIELYPPGAEKRSSQVRVRVRVSSR
jgi:hypothetical protein